MREIKFRAWHETAQEMIPNCNQGHEGDVFNWRKEGQPIQIMQYTGLKDVKGVEIYEGDIVHVEPTGQAWSVEYDEQEACFIVFNQLNSTRRFDTDFTDPECPIVSICEGMEFKPQVIGNIYEHKELIK
jgi:uncharacterized phage protein (TIGR01671 family)